MNLDLASGEVILLRIEIRDREDIPNANRESVKLHGIVVGCLLLRQSLSLVATDAGSMARINE
jgi:hypothetical protein